MVVSGTLKPVLTGEENWDSSDS